MLFRLICSALLVLAILTIGASNDEENDKSGVALPDSAGRVPAIALANPLQSEKAQAQLHFCVFENRTHDLIYVGTKYGMWFNGDFDLSFDNKVVFTGRIRQLRYQGTIFDMGDVIHVPRGSKFDLRDEKHNLTVTRITGGFK